MFYKLLILLILIFFRNIKSARLALWLNWPILTALSIATCFSGLAIYSYYHNCDPIKNGRIDSIDMYMPLFVMDTLSHVPGLPGLFIAGTVNFVIFYFKSFNIKYTHKILMVLNQSLIFFQEFLAQVWVQYQLVWTH